MKIKQEIPIFFATDNNYIACVSVAIYSLVKNSSKENNYRIIILHTGLNEKSKNDLKELESDNVKISFENIKEKISKTEKDLALRLRDYYSTSIFYRMFIPTLFPEYEKAIYLDSDVIVNDDIAKMFEIDLKDNLLGAITDQVVNTSEVFSKYSEVALGIEPVKYFNSGVLLINLREFRKCKIEEKFIYLLTKYNLDTIAPDQDYLNILCKDKVLYLSETWDKMADYGEVIDEKEVHLIHYNMFKKPWHYKEIPYSDLFWEYAKQTAYYEELMSQRDAYTEKDKKMDLAGVEKMLTYSNYIMEQPIKMVDIIKEAENFNNESFEEGYDEELKLITT